MHRATELLASRAIPLQEWPAHYESLLQEYTKLLRQSERLVRISDIMQHQLNTLNAQLDHHRHVAEQANKAKGQFLAMMSHDIRNPLAAVAVMTDLLKQTDLSAGTERIPRRYQDSFQCTAHIAGRSIGSLQD